MRHLSLEHRRANKREEHSMNEPIKILGIPGSLRNASYSRFLLRAAQQLAPKDASIEAFELHDIPPFNQDEERNPPERVSY